MGPGLGLIPGYGGTQRLPRLVGRGAALELILTGDPIDAERALELGLVNGVVADGELAGESRRLLDRVLERSPTALRRALEAVEQGLSMPLDDGLELESALFGLSFATDDMREGTSAFLEKRQPQFKGR